jgi:hypothetical protein
MKRLLLFLVVAVVSWVGVMGVDETAAGASPSQKLQPSQKQGTEYKVRGENVFAEFNSTAGCVLNIAKVFVGERVSKDEPGKLVETSIVSIFLTRYDTCSGEYLFIGDGTTTLSADAFSTQGNLQSATLNAVVPVEIDCCGDLIGSVVPATISLTWTSTGSISKSEISYTSGCFSFTGTGESRPAVATGSITLLDNEFAPQPTSTVFFTSIKEKGKLIIGCT